MLPDCGTSADRSTTVRLLVADWDVRHAAVDQWQSAAIATNRSQ